jgi:uncharacterized protein
VKRLLTALLIAPIRLYQRLISPAIGPRCRYYPTCSNYAVEAIRELGPVRGTILAAWRVLRCNPFSHGGIDELSDRKLFRGAPSGIAKMVGRHKRNCRIYREPTDPPAPI